MPKSLLPAAELPPLRIAAGCVFSNSWDILPLVVSHLVSRGVTDFFLMDHGSDQDRGEEFQRLYDGIATIHLVRKPTAPFLQSRMTSLLAETARAMDFDVFIPFDSDEFFDADTDGLPSFSEIICLWALAQKSFTLRIPMHDYVQSSAVDHFSARELSAAEYATVPPIMSTEQSRQLLHAGGSHLRRPQSFKVILNLSLVLPSDGIYISKGNHSAAIITSEGHRGESLLSSALIVRHLPYRSRDEMLSRKSLASRPNEGDYNKILSVHNRLFKSRSAPELDAYWRASSWSISAENASAHLTPATVQLVADPGLAIVLAHILEKGLPTELGDVPPTSSPASPANSASRPATFQPDFREILLSVAVDSPVGFPENNHLAYRSRELDDVYASFSWKVTRPLRVIKKAVRIVGQRMRRR